MKEEDKRVIYTLGSQTDTILDFNLTVGDTVVIGECDLMYSSVEECQFMVLETIDSIQLRDGSIRKRLNFYGHNAGIYSFVDFEVSWIDGIGSTRGLILMMNVLLCPKPSNLLFVVVNFFAIKTMVKSYFPIEKTLFFVVQGKAC